MFIDTLERFFFLKIDASLICSSDFLAFCQGLVIFSPLQSESHLPQSKYQDHLVQFISPPRRTKCDKFELVPY